MMISINLLPQEYRKKSRTPLVILLPILGGLICVLSAGAVAAYTHFNWLAEVVNEREQLQQSVAAHASRLRYEKRLLSEEAEYKKRADTIKSVADGRILMTKMIDQFIEVTVEGDALGEDESYMIWLNDLEAKPAANKSRGRARGGKKTGGLPAGEMTVKGLALADRDPLHEYNRWHKAIQQSHLYIDHMLSLTDPKGKLEEFSDGQSPAKGWNVDLTMMIRNPKEARERRAKTANIATQQPNNQKNKSSQGK